MGGWENNLSFPLLLDGVTEQANATSSWRRAVTKILIFHNGRKVLRFIMNEFVAAPRNNHHRLLLLLLLLGGAFAAKLTIFPRSSWLSCELWQWVCIVNYA